MSGSVRVLKKSGGGENAHSVFEVFFFANVHFEAKPSEVIGKEGDPFFDVGPGLKNKCDIVYIYHAESIE